MKRRATARPAEAPPRIAAVTEEPRERPAPARRGDPPDATTGENRATPRETLRAVGLGILIGGIAIVLRDGLSPVLRDRLPYVTFFPAVVIASWLGGVRAVIPCLGLAGLAAILDFPSLRASADLDPADVVGLLIYLAFSALLIGLMEVRRATEKRAVAATVSHEAARGEIAEILESISDCFYAVDREWRFTHLNAQAERYFGRPRPSLLGRNFWEAIPEKRGTIFESEFRRALDDGVRAQFEALSPATGRWVEVHVFPRSEGLSVFFRDITLRKRAEREREELLARADAARREAEQANRAKDEFLATVSHELRTPLMPILSWASLLRVDTLDEATRHRALETIERAAKSQAQLIEDLLDVSRIIAGKVRLDVRPIDVPAVIDRAIDSLRPAAEARGVRIRTVLDTRTGLVRADAERLQQVIWNLLSNAIKFTPRGGQVKVAVRRVESQAEIVVSDTGRGIRPDFLPYVFDRFRQADGATTRSHGGLGLGLAIVRHMVELHGGTVACESPGEGRGATFTVRLPLAAVQSAHAANDADGGPRDRPSIDDARRLAGISVLVVDDERDSAESIASVLTAYGAEVRVALGAEPALAILEEWRPTVLVSDVGMPEMDGYALIRRIREPPFEAGGRIPAIALTAYARVEDRVKVLGAGFQMHVAKPIEPTELVSIVASVASWPANRGSS